jgi:hypothetical protein
MKSPIPSGLRSVILAACAAALAGCSSDGGGDWIALLSLARTSWENRDAPVALEEAAAIPFATVGVRIGDAHEQILVLATDSHGERLWVAHTQVAMTTRGGRIVATAGLPFNVAGYSAANGTAANWSAPHSVRWSVDFPDLGLYSVAVACEDRPAGSDPITILGRQLDTMRVDETCRSEQLQWSFTNTYWVSEASGRVWRSTQYIHPKMDPLTIQILRPPESGS